MNIIDFLESRITADEMRAFDFEHDLALAMNGSYSNHARLYGAPAQWRVLKDLGATPARILAECAAKRDLLELFPRPESTPDGDWVESTILKVLAAVYRDHPDYDQEWALADD